MPIGISAKKSLRKSIKNRKVNASFKNKIKEVIKAFLNKTDKKSFGEVQSILDKAEKKHIYEKNKVARMKAKYSKQVGKEVEKVVIKKKTKAKAKAKAKAKKKSVKKKMS